LAGALVEALAGRPALPAADLRAGRLVVLDLGLVLGLLLARAGLRLAILRSVVCNVLVKGAP